MIKFTTILHDKRKELEISMLEYVVLNTVEKLSKPKFRAHRKTLAEFVGMSRGGLIKAINRLVEKGLLIRVNDKELAVTQKWIDETIIGVNKVDSGVNKVNSKCQQSVQPTKNRTKELELKKENIKEKFKNDVREAWEKLGGNEYMKGRHIHEFFEHWTEANKSGKMRYEKEQFFEIPKRIGTWKKNGISYGKISGGISNPNVRRNA